MFYAWNEYNVLCQNYSSIKKCLNKIKIKTWGAQTNWINSYFYHGLETFHYSDDLYFASALGGKNCNVFVCKVSGWRRGEGEVCGKSNMETYTTKCNTDSQQELAVWLRKLTQGLRVNPEGWVGEGDGSKVQKGGDICISVSDSCWGLTENDKIL